MASPHKPAPASVTTSSCIPRPTFKFHPFPIDIGRIIPLSVEGTRGCYSRSPSSSFLGRDQRTRPSGNPLSLYNIRRWQNWEPPCGSIRNCILGKALSSSLIPLSLSCACINEKRLSLESDVNSRFVWHSPPEFPTSLKYQSELAIGPCTPPPERSRTRTVDCERFGRYRSDTDNKYTEGGAALAAKQTGRWVLA